MSLLQSLFVIYDNNYNFLGIYRYVNMSSSLINCIVSECEIRLYEYKLVIWNYQRVN
jgi:hypothetical protein